VRPEPGVVAGHQQAWQLNAILHDSGPQSRGQIENRRITFSGSLEVGEPEVAIPCIRRIPAQFVQSLRVWQVDWGEHVGVEDREGRAQDAKTQSDRCSYARGKERRAPDAAQRVANVQDLQFQTHFSSADATVS